MKIRQVTSRHRVLSAVTALLLVLALGLSLTTCGLPSDLFLAVQKLKLFEQYGGFLMRYYGGDSEEEFVDVVERNDEIIVLGRTNSFGNLEMSAFLLWLSSMSIDEGIPSEILIQTSNGSSIYPVALAIDGDDNLIVVANLDDGGYDILLYSWNLDPASHSYGFEWAKRIQLPDSDELAGDILVDGDNYVIVGHSSESNKSPLVLTVRPPFGPNDYSGFYLDDSEEAEFTAIALLDNNNHLCVGYTDPDNLNPGDKNALFVELTPADSIVNARTVDFGHDENFGDVIRLGEDTIVFGGFVTYGAPWNTNGGVWWLWGTDGAYANQFSLAAWFSGTDPSVGVTSLGPAGLHYTADHFLVGGDFFDSFLMNTSGEILWAAAHVDNGLLDQNSRAIIPIQNNVQAFFHVGGSSWRPETDENVSSDEPEAVALWGLPDDGTSYPATDVAELVTVEATGWTEMEDFYSDSNKVTLPPDLLQNYDLDHSVDLQIPVTPLADY